MATPEQEYLDRANRVEDVVNRKSYGLADVLPQKNDLIGEGITRILETVGGMPEAKGSAPLVPKRPVAEGITTKAKDVTAPKTHPAEGFPDEWAFAEHLVKSDPTGKKFKSWVDENQDRVSGMGYVEVADGPNKGRIVPTISRPEPKQGGGYGLGDAVSQAESILGRRPTLGDMRDLAPILSNQRAADVESRKLAFEVEKFAKSNDMKDPINFMKVAASIAPKKKVTTYDDAGNATTEEQPDLAAGVRAMESMGYKPPKGISAPVTKKVLTEADARAQLAAKNITGKDADKYIANYKSRGVVQ
jgi:hypothetical protein